MSRQATPSKNNYKLLKLNEILSFVIFRNVGISLALYNKEITAPQRMAQL
jgi:hypothetical protein